MMSERPILGVVCWVMFVASAPIIAQNRRALLIGIAHYAPPAGATLPISPAGHSPDSRFAQGQSWSDLEGPPVDVTSMQVLLRETYGFKDIRVLQEEQATRQGILAALDRLIADTQPGDLDVFYYAGHGSLRIDTLSSKRNELCRQNGCDETIVPIDAWKGTEDIRDKELAMKFNKIVYEKRAHVTAIFDSCHSGTMARGVTNSVQRVLPYDDRDVAEEKKKDQATVVEADLKQVPQQGDAIIIAAAASNESAVEAKYPDDSEFHGVFTRALVRILSSTTQTLSADDVVAGVSNMLHADPIPFQQPSVEGRTHQSLFGDPVAAHALHVHVARVSGSIVQLDMGSAAGFDVGTQFTALEFGSAKEKTVIEIQQIANPLSSTAQVVKGSADVKVGQTFELSQMVYPRAARLTIFSGKPEPSAADAIANANRMFPGLTWVVEPTLEAVDYLVVEGEHGWVAYDQRGIAVSPGLSAKGKAFLLLGPTPALMSALEQALPFQRQAFSFTSRISEANYLLARQPTTDPTAQYALFDPIILPPQYDKEGHALPRKQDTWVTSPETDPDDAAINGGQQPEVVCRNDVSLPVRTAWLPDHSGTGKDVAIALNRRIVRLGKLRVWMQTPAIAPGLQGWPYHLLVTQSGGDTPLSGLLHAKSQYDARLVTTAEERAAAIITPSYVYLFGFDCAANPFLLYPTKGFTSEKVPQPDEGGVFPISYKILTEGVDKPFGADSLFLLVTAERIMTPELLLSDGVVERESRGVGGNRFEELMTEMSDAGTRGPKSVPTDWFVQQIVVPSRP